MQIDPALDTLLDLDGSILDQGNGYWIKMEARRTDVTVEVPHGIGYSLTLHASDGKRILGYDNAHMVKPPKKFKYAGRILTFDHKHRPPPIKECPMNSRMRSNSSTIFLQMWIAYCWR